MLDIVLIRHSKTEGNRKGRYIGTTDEPLCAEGIELLNQRKKDYPHVQFVYVSPLKRCVQTADIIYPGQSKLVLEDLKECDFGDFENKNYLELDGNPEYQKWVDSHGALPFPNGESQEEFQQRCCAAFMSALEDALYKQYESIGLVVHGGTIMSIMEQYAVPKKPFFEWQVKNAHGFLLQTDQEELDNGKRIYLKSCI